ncbi:MAG: preQ(1) synthase [bacterium]|nr:preQ(1) synthase [bacterium]
MPKAEGRTWDILPETAIGTNLLETHPFRSGLPTGVEEKVHIETEEFSAVCPFSGLPDIAKVVIDYVPGDRIVELKSLKYYFVSFRNVGIYQEMATKRIYGDLRNLLNPNRLFVKTVYRTRGGMDVTCSIGEPF